MQHRLNRIQVVLCGVFWFCVCWGSAAQSPAQAAAGPRFALTPITPLQAHLNYSLLEATPAQTIACVVRVTNKGNQTGTVRLYTVDGTTGQTTGLVFFGSTDPKRDAGSWIDFPAQSVRLTPGASKDIAYQVHVPASTRPGAHVGGIVAENLVSPATTDASPLKIKEVAIMAVQVDVSGTATTLLNATNLTVQNEAASPTIYITLTNAGDTLLKPFGTFTLGTQTDTLQRDTITMDTFLPINTINYPIRLQHAPLAPGDYTAWLHLNYGHGQILDYTVRFTIDGSQPIQNVTATTQQSHRATDVGDEDGWLLCLLAILIAVFIVLLRKLLLRNRRQRKQVRLRPSYS
jgi:hypothetical protein